LNSGTTYHFWMGTLGHLAPDCGVGRQIRILEIFSHNF
jgi:hypothetical protein